MCVLLCVLLSSSSPSRRAQLRYSGCPKCCKHGRATEILCLPEPFRVHKAESFLRQIRLIVYNLNPRRVLTRIACSGTALSARRATHFTFWSPLSAYRKCCFQSLKTNSVGHLIRLLNLWMLTKSGRKGDDLGFSGPGRVLGYPPPPSPPTTHNPHSTHAPHLVPPSPTAFDFTKSFRLFHSTFFILFFVGVGTWWDGVKDSSVVFVFVTFFHSSDRLVLLFFRNARFCLHSSRSVLWALSLLRLLISFHVRLALLSHPLSFSAPCP